MDINYLDFEEKTRLFEGQKNSPTETENDFDPNEFERMPEFKKLDGIGRDQDRYVWFGGNVMSAAEKNSRKDLFLGGENFGSDFPALGISKYALIRGRITPIMMAPRPQAKDEPVVNPTVVGFEGDLVGDGDVSRVRHVKAFPGDQLEAIVYGARDGSTKGIVELTAFQKMPYKDRQTQLAVYHTQHSIFPDWDLWIKREKPMPPTLRELERIIREAREKYADAEYIPLTCTEMLTGCGEFRLYGLRYLQREGLRVRAGVHPNGGYVHSYSGVAEELLIQLEMKRENLLDDKSDVYKDFNPQEMYKAFAEMNRETIKAVFEANRDLIAEVLGKKENSDLPDKKTEDSESIDQEAELKKQLESIDREVLVKQCKERNIEFPQKANKLQLWNLLNPKQDNVNN